MSNIQIKGNKYLQRDPSSKMLVSTNIEELQRYNSQKNLIKHNKDVAEEIFHLRQIITELSKQMESLKNKEST